MTVKKSDKHINIEIYWGGGSVLEARAIEGILQFAQSRPHWRFSVRDLNFRYSKSWLLKHNIDGVIAAVNADSVARSLNAAKVPWVYLLPGKPTKHTYVTADNIAIGRMGAQYLRDKGFESYAFCDVATSWSHDRRKGFIDNLSSGQTIKCSTLDISFEELNHWRSPASIDKKLLTWIKSLPRRTAIMAAHDTLANRIVDLCVQNKINVPEHISVLGVGDHDLQCRLCPVQISSINGAVPEMSLKAAEVLEKMINGEKILSVEIAPKTVIERRSTDIARYADPMIAEMVSYIRDNICNGVTVEDITENFHTTRRTLLRHFHKHVGHNPAQEIIHARLLQAKKMLAETDLPLNQIALTCHYSDLSHMNRSFQDMAGISPGAFRKRAANRITYR